MSDVLVGGLIAISSAVVGAGVTGYFSLYQEWRREKHERQSIRTLLSLEILQNLTALRLLRGVLENLLVYADSSSTALAFLVTASPPQWQTTRWSTQEVGRHLASSELMRLGEWYTKLDGVSLLYQRLLTQLQHLQTADGEYRMNEVVGDDAVRQIEAIIRYVADLQVYPPPLLDAKLNSGKSIADYLADLRQRQPKLSPLASDAAEAAE